MGILSAVALHEVLDQKFRISLVQKFFALKKENSEKAKEKYVLQKFTKFINPNASLAELFRLDNVHDSILLVQGAAETKEMDTITLIKEIEELKLEKKANDEDIAAEKKEVVALGTYNTSLIKEAAHNLENVQKYNAQALRLIEHATFAVEKGDYEYAQNIYEQSIQVHKTALAYYYLARLNWIQNNIEEAEKQTEKATDIIEISDKLLNIALTNLKSSISIKKFKKNNVIKIAEITIYNYKSDNNINSLVIDIIKSLGYITFIKTNGKPTNLSQGGDVTIVANQESQKDVTKVISALKKQSDIQTNVTISDSEEKIPFLYKSYSKFFYVSILLSNKS
ncbi:MAG: tetratricopeptide repeat protein [Thaumarchaeota archaeon]|nr:tetratricopeptide repeat protein [Nitrososphaerota archaeon]